MNAATGAQEQRFANGTRKVAKAANNTLVPTVSCSQISKSELLMQYFDEDDDRYVVDIARLLVIADNHFEQKFETNYYYIFFTFSAIEKLDRAAV